MSRTVSFRYSLGGIPLDVTAKIADPDYRGQLRDVYDIEATCDTFGGIVQVDIESINPKLMDELAEKALDADIGPPRRSRMR